jgi:hypothetical protein
VTGVKMVSAVAIHRRIHSPRAQVSGAHCGTRCSLAYGSTTAVLDRMGSDLQR